MNDNLENYSLLKSNNTHNYNNKNYNNYQSWSNVRNSIIKISSIDEHGNTQTTEQKTSKLERLNEPVSTFTDTNLSWVSKEETKKCKIDK